MTSFDELDLHMALLHKREPKTTTTTTITRVKGVAEKKRKLEEEEEKTDFGPHLNKTFKKKKTTASPVPSVEGGGQLVALVFGSDATNIAQRLDQKLYNRSVKQWLENEHPMRRKHIQKCAHEERLKREKDNDPENFSICVPIVIGSFVKELEKDVEETKKTGGEEDEYTKRFSTSHGFTLQAVFFEYYTKTCKVLITDNETGKTFHKVDKRIIRSSLKFKEQCLKFLKPILEQQEKNFRNAEGYPKPASSSFFVKKGGELSISKDNWFKLKESFQ